MPDPISNVHDLEAERAARMNPALPAEPELPLQHGGGGGTWDSMEERVTRLETHFEYVRRDLDGLAKGQAVILEKLDVLADRTKDLPSKRDLTVFNWQTAALAAAIIAIIVGGIIGGLGWIKPDASPPAPVVIQIPSQAAGGARHP